MSMRDTCGKPPSMPFTVEEVLDQYSMEVEGVMLESGAGEERVLVVGMVGV